MNTRDDALRELNEKRLGSKIPWTEIKIPYQDGAGNRFSLNWHHQNGVYDELLFRNPNPIVNKTNSSKKNDFDLMTFLKKEHYGVPVYGWGLGVIGVTGVAGLAYYFLRRR